MGNWLSKKEVAKLLNVHYMTLERYMRAGKIPYYKADGGQSSRVRFLREDVINFIKKMKH